MANSVHLRRDVWKLDDWDPILIWYARGIAVMQQRQPQDPTSWRYQAAIHDYTGPVSQALRPYWRQCQHFTWYFLPWHRMYLHHFEETVRAAIVTLSGPADWALPFWNYSIPGRRRLPPAFYAPTMPDGSSNPLRIDERYYEANQGLEIGEPTDTDLSLSMDERSFTGVGGGGSTGFGGGVTGFNHGPPGPAGVLEGVPHGAMHMAVGGNMTGFDTAALDPIFWLHHSNIDRLWEAWLRLRPTNRNPVDQRWMNFPFQFHNAGGLPVTMTSAQVLDTTQPPLSYRYEDLGALPEMAAGLEAAERPMDQGRVPEMIGATDTPIALTSQPTTASVPVTAPTGPARGMLESATARDRTFLNIENIVSSGPAVPYDVYLNVPEGDDPRAHAELLAGVLPMFGLVESTRNDDAHSGSGLNYSLEITRVVRVLRVGGGWNPERLRVTFVPRRPTERPSIRESAPAPVTVGRVSLYIA